ncbi:MAG: DnaA regulatory inactivator Hda [Gammaproteobacteria bacterium]|nr:DnaA regulatory inactivator Hda [Gammaproteobacteria bacterium]MBU2675664.1 DnaA regulatory inactivator Hda [Gammaproteobacteria bacterium]NNC56537.1 DnaA regulatory inactivator Hda [Woeseiaceae bacterium]NNL49399.1 DnaA regulatory inactivator Hda [Woeseiaceae bacterium]
MSQLVLPLRLADHAVFASFHAHGNESLVATLCELADGSSESGGFGSWIWGAAATGKTHLLQAICDRAGDRSAYVPLSVFAAGGPTSLEGLASRELVCIDDIEKVAGDSDWETALFDLFNQVFDAGGQMIVAASMAPRECPIQLPDLASRLSQLPVFHIRALDDEQRVSALQLRARHRGLELPDDSARYLLKRSRRDMASLYELLDKLDLEALRAKRRVTIPFVRGVLQQTESS